MKNKMIITLTGHKNSGLDKVAMKLANNSDVEYVVPYTDAPVRSDSIFSKNGTEAHFVSKERLDKAIEHQKVLSETLVNGHRYVFFESQMKANFNVIAVDDYALVDVRTNWKGKLYTIKVRSKNEIESDRVGEYYYDHEFNEVFDFDEDDFDELEARIDDAGRF